MLDGKSIDQSSNYDPAHPYDKRDPRLTATVIYDNYKWSENVNDGSVNEVIYTNPSSNTPDAYKRYKCQLFGYRLLHKKVL